MNIVGQAIVAALPEEAKRGDMDTTKDICRVLYNVELDELRSVVDRIETIHREKVTGLHRRAQVAESEAYSAQKIAHGAFLSFVERMKIVTTQRENWRRIAEQALAEAERPRSLFERLFGG